MDGGGTTLGSHLFASHFEGLAWSVRFAFSPHRLPEQPLHEPHEPLVLGRIMLFHQPVLRVARLRAGLAVAGPGRLLPAAETLRRHFRVKLQAESVVAVLEGLPWK